MAEKVTKYSVLEFTEYPGPRYQTQGTHSGEEFFQEVLKPLFEKLLLEEKKDPENDYFLEVNLDSTAGYASSFLDEAFGNLAYEFSQEVVIPRLRIISNEEPDWVSVIKNETVAEWEQKRVNGIPRKPHFEKRK
jgi:hypothetical protein